MNIKWQNRFYEEARQKSKWSKDPSKQVGAIAIGEYNQIIATGYNGFPRGISDTTERYNDRETKYKYVVHAEMNLIYNACLTGISLQDAKLFVHGLPICSECAKGIIQCGIKEVYWKVSDLDNDRWKESSELAISMFEEVGIKYKYTIESIKD